MAKRDLALLTWPCSIVQDFLWCPEQSAHYIFSVGLYMALFHSSRLSMESRPLHISSRFVLANLLYCDSTKHYGGTKVRWHKSDMEDIFYTTCARSS